MVSDMHIVPNLSICYTVPVADTPSAPLHYRFRTDASKLKLQKEQMFSFTSIGHTDTVGCTSMYQVFDICSSTTCHYPNTRA